MNLFWDEVLQHVPSELADRACHAADAGNIDAIVSVGGGSATGLAKAIALSKGLPIVAVPTTYAGSEATPIWGLTTDHRKVTGHDSVVLPVSVVHDADLALSLPVELSVASGLNALALNAPAVPAMARRIAQALSVSVDGELAAGAGSPLDSVRRLTALVESLGAPRPLRELGMMEQDIPGAAAETLVVTPPSNPFPVTIEVLESLLRRAWSGEEPKVVDDARLA